MDAGAQHEPRTDEAQVDPLERARLALRSGAVAEALAGLEGLVEEAFERGDQQLQAEALRTMAEALRRSGSSEQALLCAERAVQPARAAGARSAAAEALLLQAELLQAQGELARARDRLSEGVRELDAGADECRARGDAAAAVALLERAVEARDLLLALQGSGGAERLRVLQLEAVERGAARQQEDLLRTLYAVSRQLVAERDPARVVVGILDNVVQATGAERGFVLLAPDPDLPAGEGGWLPGGLEVAAARNFDRVTLRKPHLKVSRAVVEEALRRREPVLVHDAGRESDLAGHTSIQEQRLRSIVCVPFESPRGRGVRGALYLDNRFSQGAFAAATLEALDAFAAHAAVALENARLHALATREREALDRARGRAEELARRLEAELSRTGEELGVVRARLEQAQGQLSERGSLGRIVGRSQPMQRVYAFIEKVGPAEHPVLVRGESGTGKELVARAIHVHGPRRDAPFVSENCGAIPATLLESVLFGHEAGAFTGATERRPGIFELAGAGTLFLDEVGELPLASQAALLRVLEERTVRRVGGSEEIPVRARLVCATNRDLEEMVREGGFREDLYYRLNVLAVRLPPLRERRDDLPLLLEHLLERTAADMGREVPSLTPKARRALLRYDWPGNVRELENEVQRLLTLSGDEVDTPDLSPAVREGGELRDERPPQALLEEGAGLPTLQEAERRLIVAALEQTGGNKQRAASLLGIPRGTLWHKMKQHRVEG